MIKCEKGFPGMSGEAFSTFLNIHVNTMNKVFNLLNSKIFSTNINNKYSEYNKRLTM